MARCSNLLSELKFLMRSLLVVTALRIADTLNFHVYFQGLNANVRFIFS